MFVLPARRARRVARDARLFFEPRSHVAAIGSVAAFGIARDESTDRRFVSLEISSKFLRLKRDRYIFGH